MARPFLLFVRPNRKSASEVSASRLHACQHLKNGLDRRRSSATIGSGTAVVSIHGVDRMRKQLKLLVGVLAATALITTARADTIAYNTSLAAGYYNGVGNPNVGFTTDTTSSGIQLGLGVNLRYIGPVIPSSTNNYTVPLGTSSSPPSGAAIWDFEYSVDFGTSGLSTSNTAAALTVLNTANGQTLTFDPSSALLGNATNGSGYQNAENLGFASFAFLFPSFDFNPNAVDQYVITLSLDNATGTTLASVTENVNATPVPAALSLFAGGLGILGLFGARNRRRALAA
jgi:hypothetical protein